MSDIYIAVYLTIWIILNYLIQRISVGGLSLVNKKAQNGRTFLAGVETSQRWVQRLSEKKNLGPSQRRWIYNEEKTVRIPKCNNNHCKEYWPGNHLFLLGRAPTGVDDKKIRSENSERNESIESNPGPK